MSQGFYYFQLLLYPFFSFFSSCFLSKAISFCNGCIIICISLLNSSTDIWDGKGMTSSTMKAVLNCSMIQILLVGGFPKPHKTQKTIFSKDSFFKEKGNKNFTN